MNYRTWIHRIRGRVAAGMLVCAISFALNSGAHTQQAKEDRVGSPAHSDNQTLAEGRFPDLGPLLLSAGMALVIAWLGYSLFKRIEQGFADAI